MWCIHQLFRSHEFIHPLMLLQLMSAYIHMLILCRWRVMDDPSLVKDKSFMSDESVFDHYLNAASIAHLILTYHSDDVFWEEVFRLGQHCSNYNEVLFGAARMAGHGKLRCHTVQSFLEFLPAYMSEIKLKHECDHKSRLSKPLESLFDLFGDRSAISEDDLTAALSHMWQQGEYMARLRLYHAIRIDSTHAVEPVCLRQFAHKLYVFTYVAHVLVLFHFDIN
jgi:hypothetical protein